MLQTRPGDAEGSSSLIDGYATATRAGARRKLRKEGTFLNRSTDAGGPWSTVTGPGIIRGMLNSDTSLTVGDFTRCTARENLAKNVSDLSLGKPHVCGVLED